MPIFPLIPSLNLSDVANAATARTNLGVAIGTNVQAFDADLDALAALAGTNTIYYRSAANTWSAVTFSGLTFSGGVLTASGGTVLASCNDFRLTLTTGTPVLTSDTTGAGTLYLTPFKGRQISLYSGSAWEILSSAEVSLSLTLTSGKNYDVFAYNNAGTLTLELSAAWTNSTTRADAITTQDGVYVKSGATTRRLVGTIYATGTNQTGMKFGRTAAAGGSAPFCAVWNMDNRVRQSFFNLDSVTSATRTLDASWRWYNWLASTANIFTFVQGLASNVRGDFRALGSASAGTWNVGIGLDVSGLPNTTAASGIMAGTNSTSAVLTQAAAIFDQSVGIGMHTLSCLEMPNSANDTTFYGDLGLAGTQFQSGACFEVEA